MKVPRKVETKSSKPEKPKTMTHSKILKCIVMCLEKNKYPHVLYWNNREKQEFVIVFVHKSNPAWNARYLDLFKELDGLSKKKWDLYSQKPNYESECKVRCKSNIKKLCNEGVLSVCWKNNENKSKFSVCYKINDSSGKYLSLSVEQKNFELTIERDIQGAIEDMSHDLITLASDCPCLSNQSLVPFQDLGCGTSECKSVLRDKNNMDHAQAMSSKSEINHNQRFKNQNKSEFNSIGTEGAFEDMNKKIVIPTSAFPHFSQAFPNKGIGTQGAFKDMNKEILIPSSVLSQNLVSCQDHSARSGNRLENENGHNYIMELDMSDPNAVEIGSDENYEEYADFYDANAVAVCNGENFEEHADFYDRNAEVVGKSENNGEHTDFSLHQNKDMFSSCERKKDNSLHLVSVKERSYGVNAAMPDTLSNTEFSFNLNDLIDKEIAQFEFETDFNKISLNPSFTGEINNLYSTLDESWVLQKDKDPFVCCGLRASCSCKDEKIDGNCN